MANPQLPELLQPQSSQRIKLPSGRDVSVQKVKLLLRRWSGEPPTDTYNHKPVLEFDGEMVFGELAILRIFQRAGWQGRWIDSYRHKYRIGYWGAEKDLSPELPIEQPSIPLWKEIRAKAHCHGGCFDVFCWRDARVIFAESKWRDELLPTQIAWLEDTLNIGIPLESFLIVQWGFETRPRPPLSKELQLRVFRRDKWICRWCNRPVIFGAAMRLLEREMRDAGRTEQLAYWHAHSPRDAAPLLDELLAVIDHVEAHSTGGSTAEVNLTTACNKCNTQKSAGTSEQHRARHPHKPVKGRYGEPQHWDGLSGVFVMLASRNPTGLSDNEKAWLKVLTAEILANETP